MTKAKELITYETDELERFLGQLRMELIALKFQKAASQLTSSVRFKYVKREIARILTVLRERELQIAHILPKEGKKVEFVKSYSVTQKPLKKEKEPADELNEADNLNEEGIAKDQEIANNDSGENEDLTGDGTQITDSPEAREVGNES